MGIDKDKPSIIKYTPVKGTISNSKPDEKSLEPEKQKTKNPKFISEDVKNYFSYNIKNNFDRSASSKNSVTYDLHSFDEDES